MMEAQRRAYLEAMDIEVWVSKPATTLQDHLVIGPGSGSTLLVCRDGLEASTALAADICRYLGDKPVWAWPDPDGGQDHPTLKQAVDLGLYIRIVFLGQCIAGQMFKGAVPELLVSARIIVAPDLDQLTVSAEFRKKLWQLLSETTSAGSQ